MVAHRTWGILLKSHSLHWVLLHLHSQSARWQARIHFHKKETASHPQTIVQASAFIFKLGGDSSHLGQELGRWHLTEVTLAALPARSWFQHFFFFLCMPEQRETLEGVSLTVTGSLCEIGQLRPKLQMSVKINSISKRLCAFPSSVCSLLHQPRIARVLVESTLGPLDKELTAQNTLSLLRLVPVFHVLFFCYCCFVLFCFVRLFVFMVPLADNRNQGKEANWHWHTFLRVPSFWHLSDTVQNLFPALEESSCHLHSFTIMGPLLSPWNSCLGVPLPCSKHEGPSWHMGGWSNTVRG